MKMRYLSKREVRELIHSLRESFSLEKLFEEILEVETSIGEKRILFYIASEESEKTPLLINISGEVVPAIHSLNKNILKTGYVKIDRGAVPRILGGADVMAPGIVETSVFERDSVVGVREPERGLYIAVGRALMSSEEIMRTRRGRAVRVVHYAGDSVWRVLIEVLKRI